MRITLNRLVGVAAALALAGVLSACDISAGIVRGSGNVITEQRPVSGVSDVALAMSGSLTIQQDGTESLTIEAEDNIVPLITTQVSGSKLTIGTKPNTSFNTTKGINIRLSVRNLNSISNSASGAIKTGNLNGSQMAVQASGSGPISISGMSANGLTASVSGSGSVTTSGTVERQDVTVSGSGSYNGTGLQSKNATAVVTGSGSATVNVSDNLAATVSGSGSVRYIGQPSVTKNDSGSGDVVKISEK